VFNTGVSALNTKVTHMPRTFVATSTTDEVLEGVPPAGVPQNAAAGRINGAERLSAGCLGLNVSGNYDGGSFYDANNRVKQQPYVLLNAEVSFAPTSVPGLRLVLWGKNLTDHAYL
jgi:hypothetical protein